MRSTADSDNRHAFLITFSTRCPTCQTLQPKWMQAARELRATRRWKVIWVSADEPEIPRRFVEQHGIPAEEVISNPNLSYAQKLRMSSVPQVMAMDPTGGVRQAWVGLQPWTVASIMAGTS